MIQGGIRTPPHLQVEHVAATLHELPVEDGEVFRREGSDSAEPGVVPQARVRNGGKAEVRVADAAAVEVQRPLHGRWTVLLHARDGGLQQPDAMRQNGLLTGCKGNVLASKNRSGMA